MKRELNYFLTKHVEIFEKILKFLWKTPITINEVVINPQKKENFFATFMVENGEDIQLEVLIDIGKQKKIERMSIVYKSYFDQTEKIEKYLALSFLYHCPYDLELCNQYGLYTKEDIKVMEEMENPKEILEYKEQQNLLKNNQFYIFNMDYIHNHCADPMLDELLQEIHTMVVEWNNIIL